MPMWLLHVYNLLITLLKCPKQVKINTHSFLSRLGISIEDPLGFNHLVFMFK